MFSWLSLHGQKGEFHWASPLKDQSGLYVTPIKKVFDTPAHVHTDLYWQYPLSKTSYSII